MNKKLVSLLMAAIMIVSLGACQKKPSADAEEKQAVTETGQKEVTPKESEKKESAEKKETQDAFTPKQNFNIRVPFAAGGAADTIARIFAQGLQKIYGKTAVVNNLTGANGAIAAMDLLNKPTDTTELMVGGIGMFTLAPLFNKDVKLNLEDYQFVCSLVSEDIMLFVNPEKTGIKSWEELKQYAEKERIIFGSNPPGGTTHLLGTMLFGEAGIEAEAVTSDGSAKDLLALVGGNVVCALATSSLGSQYVEEGSLVPIVVFSEQPYTGYKEMTVPTAKSFGYDVVFRTCNFLMTKSDAPKEEVAALHQAILSYTETDEFKELAQNANYVPSIEDGETIMKTIQNAVDMCRQAYQKYYAK